jgi:hypothetical protein
MKNGFVQVLLLLLCIDLSAHGQQPATSTSPPASSVISRPRPGNSTNNAPLTPKPTGRLSGALSSLSHDTVALGLKQALTNGVQAAIRELGHDGGFLTNLNFRIPMPKQLTTIEEALRAIKEEKLADQFVAAMNHAAEKAVPEGASIFADSISRITIADAESILTGPPDAATQFFRRTAETNLYQRFLPIVKKATDAAGVTSNYKKVLNAAGKNKYVGELLGAVTDPKSLDLDKYVTDKALDGLFKRIAQEEKRIREDPVARTSDLLKEVFGAIRK